MRSGLTMITDPVFFRDLAYVFVAAVLGGTLAWLTRQPLILGYVLGGVLISPLTPGPSVSDIHTFELFAEIGVVLLMFSVGIEFSLQDLLRVKWVALLGAPLGIVLCVGLGMGVGIALGWPPLQGAIVGIVVSVASTMVLARLLLDRGELHSRHGRVMIGITLVEDLAVVILTVLIPEFSALEGERLVAIAVALARAGLILIPFWFLAARVVPHLLARVARTHNQELFLLVALAIGLGTAALTQAVGLSLALGAFLAGLLISGSDFAHETLARLLPLRDVYNATLAASLLTILINALLVRYATDWIGRARLARPPQPALPEAGDLRDHVVLCGFGRVGSAVGEALETFRLPYVVIDMDPDIVKGLRARAIPCLFGDAAQRRIQEAAGVARAALVLVTIPEDDHARLAIRAMRALNPEVPILARVHHREAHDALRAAGATEVIQPELEAGVTLIRRGLGQLPLPKQSLIAYLECLRHAISGAPERAARQGVPEACELTLGPDSFADQPLREARLRERFGVTVVRIVRTNGDVVLSPEAETLLRPGDRISVFGLPHQIEAFVAAARAQEEGPGRPAT